MRLRLRYLWLTIALCGCQMPAAHLAPCAGSKWDRGKLLAHQLITDTAVETECHPLHAGWAVLSTPGLLLCTATQELTGSRLAVACADPPPSILPERPSLDPDALEADLVKVCPHLPHPACISLFPEGHEALAALLQVIDEATETLDLMMFMWDSDEVGETIATHIAQRAAAGVRVRALVDGGGNLIFREQKQIREPNRVVCWLAEQPGVEILRTRNGFCRFDHRKLVVADGKRVWTGGRNFTDRSFFGQRDLSYVLRGPMANDFEALFNDFWHEEGGRPGNPGPRAEEDVIGNATARLVGTSPASHDLGKAILHAVEHARHHISIENVYFSDPWIVGALAKARQRGVDVRVMLTLHSDNDVVKRSNRVTANRLLSAGVRVFLYPGMLHTKAALVDGAWAYVGTGNFDPLSLRHNRELGIAIGDGEVIRELEATQFESWQPEWEMHEPLPTTFKDHASELLASLCL